LIIHLDTSILIDEFAQPGQPRLGNAIREGHRLTLAAIVLYEWLRRSRSIEEISLQRALFPETTLATFGAETARIAARIYGAMPRARSREIDIAIAAAAIEHGAWLWTVNTEDFHDIPGVTLYRG
jgi:predicted nucleic acid-binding protein